ncbi:MAG: acyl-ACP--UDP-N-acetylglucosamine O-acyltransferase [Verrucomicrobiae bacterium]|nr:acyl-ACP--UDP-N-acetylglucosamine O-acyltransferase [Verrucomicrobiae bacterium]
MTHIDSQAIVSEKAILGQDVRIEAGAVVEAGAIIGDRCIIRSHAVVTGSVQMGEGNLIGYGAIIGADPQDVNYRGENALVKIGDNNVIREYVTIHRGSRDGGITQIGSRCFFMVGAHVAHDCHVEDEVVLVNHVLLAGHVKVGRRAFLGGAAVVHQHVRIGRLAILRGNIAVGKDVPPFAMAVGTNAVSGLNRVGLRRAGISEQVRRELEKIFFILYREGLNRAQALEKIKGLDWKSSEAFEFIEFVEKTRRGICRFYKGEDFIAE